MFQLFVKGVFQIFWALRATTKTGAMPGGFAAWRDSPTAVLEVCYAAFDGAVVSRHPSDSGIAPDTNAGVAGTRTNTNSTKGWAIWTRMAIMAIIGKAR